MSQLSDLLSPATQAVLLAAQELADQRREHLSSAHVAKALFEVNETAAHDLLRSAGLTQLALPVATLKGSDEEIPLLIEQAAQVAQSYRFSAIEPEHLLLVLVQQGNLAGHLLLQQAGSDLQFVQKKTNEWLYGLSLLRNLRSSPTPGGNQPSTPTGAPEPSWNSNSVIDLACRDLTAAAAEDLLDTVVGRHVEIASLVRILLRRTKNNPLLIGDPGVGKTALAHGLAQRIVGGEVPARLQSKRLLELSTASLIAGTMYRGQFEERVRQLIQEVAEAGDIVLFIDEIHTMTGTGGAEGSLDLANLLKPALASGEISVIGATTYEEYTRHFANDRALDRRFQPIFVCEPSRESTTIILRTAAKQLGEHHHVTITPSAIKAAVELSERYVPGRALPDKALDLLDEACAAAQAVAVPPSQAAELKEKLASVMTEKTRLIESGELQKALALRQLEQKLMKQLLSLPPAAEKAVVDETAVAAVISEQTGIPVERIQQHAPQPEELLTALRQKIVGQDAALQEVVEQLTRVHAGLGNPRQPLGSFVFLGPTGVGKTETARVIARELFGTDEALIKIDMSELGERHTVSQLIGSPKGYVGHEEGGVLTDKIRRRPASVVLFDEIEKAHPDIFNLLLQILEDGVVTDTHGRSASFSQSLIILTSNLGSEVWQNVPGLGFVPADRDIEGELERTLDDFFRPELLARLSGIVTFTPFAPSAVRQLLRRRLNLVKATLRGKGIQLTITPTALQALASRYDPAKGARSVDELVRRSVESPVVRLIAAGQRGRVALTADDKGEIRLQTLDPVNS